MTPTRLRELAEKLRWTTGAAALVAEVRDPVGPAVEAAAALRAYADLLERLLYMTRHHTGGEWTLNRDIREVLDGPGADTLPSTQR